jgi:hypothetical protein
MNNLSNFDPSISSAPLNRDTTLFPKQIEDLVAEEIFKIFCLQTCNIKILAANPIFTNLPTLLECFYAKNCSYILEELQCSREKFEYQLLYLMDVFRETKDSTQLVVFLKRILIILNKDKEFSTTSFNLLINALETNRLDLFYQPAAYFLNPKIEYSSHDRYLIALRNYHVVDYSLMQCQRIMGFRIDEHEKSRMSTSNPFNIPFEILRNKKFTLQQTVFLRISLNNISKKYFEERNILFCVDNSLKYDLCKNYHPIINSTELKKMFENPNKNCDIKYVNVHQEAYENYLPRVQEIYDAFIESSSSIQRIFLISKDLQLYFIFGNTDKLQDKLVNQSLSYKALEEFIFEEVTKFSNQINNDSILKVKIIEFLKKPENRELAKLRLQAGVSESNYRDYKNVMRWTVKDSLEAAKQYQDALWICSEAAMKNSRFTPIRKSPESSQTKASNRQIKKEPLLISKEEIDKPAPPIAKVPQELSLSQQLDNTRLSFRDGFKCLKISNKSSRYVEEALSNTESHLSNLLCTFNRLYSSVDNLPPRVFHSFAIDCIRYGTLAAEQMLSALDRANNNIKDSKELNEHLSHNLYRILLSCKFTKVSFPQMLRDFIFQIRGGEVWLRNLDQCEWGGTLLQNLLYKLKLFEEGKNISSVQAIFHEILDFSRNVGFLVFHMQKSFSHPSANKSSIAFDDFYKNWENVIKFLKRKQIFLAEKSTLIISETPIRQTILCLHEKIKEMGFKKMFENIFNHLLVHLETEIALSQELKLTELHLHCGNIFLLNQMILEEILQKLIYAYNVSHSFEKGHNLWAMMSSLGFIEEEFLNNPQELEFLKSGKDIRQLVRYTASYESVKRNITNEKKQAQRGMIDHIDSTLNEVLKLSKNQPFVHDEILGQGFQGKRSKENMQKMLLKSVEDNLTVMLSILNRLVKKSL